MTVSESISGEPPTFSCGDSDRLIGSGTLSTLQRTKRPSCEQSGLVSGLRIEECVCHGELCNNGANSACPASTIVIAATTLAFVYANLQRAGLL